MLSQTFVTADNYPAQPQIGPDAAGVSLVVLVGGPVFCKITQGAHGQHQTMDEIRLSQSASFAGATGGFFRSATAGTPVNVECYLFQTKDPLPSYIAAGATQIVAAGAFLGLTVLTSTAAATFTTQATTTKIIVEMVAGGGGGGGCPNNVANRYGGGGGGAGGYAMKQFAVSGATGYPFQCGAAGAGSSGANGTDGLNSTFNVGPTTITCLGGKGGVVALSAGQAFGGAGGAVSTNGDVNSGGQPGWPGNAQAANNPYAGNGADTQFGSGGQGGLVTGGGAGQSIGGSALGYGSGGGGSASNTTAGAIAGGNGRQGIILVSEFT